MLIRGWFEMNVVPAPSVIAKQPQWLLVAHHAHKIVFVYFWPFLRMVRVAASDLGRLQQKPQTPWGRHQYLVRLSSNFTAHMQDSHDHFCSDIPFFFMISTELPRPLSDTEMIHLGWIKHSNSVTMTSRASSMELSNDFKYHVVANQLPSIRIADIHCRGVTYGI